MTVMTGWICGVALGIEYSVDENAWVIDLFLIRLVIFPHDA
jgi:hypothetical protein